MKFISTANHSRNTHESGMRSIVGSSSMFSFISIATCLLFLSTVYWRWGYILKFDLCRVNPHTSVKSVVSSTWESSGLSATELCVGDSISSFLRWHIFQMSVKCFLITLNVQLSIGDLKKIQDQMSRSLSMPQILPNKKHLILVKKGTWYFRVSCS